jgi:hypothetical protein
MGAIARPGTPPAAPAPPLGACPGRRRACTQPGTCSRRGRRSAGSRRLAARHRLRPRPRHHRPAPARRRRYLRDAQHADAMLCRLVAHHSCALIEAGERGLADVLNSEFDPAPDVLASVLTCCDMITSPDGQPVPADRRLAEIQDRYGPGHLVSRSIQRATPMISAQSSRSIKEPPRPRSSADRRQTGAPRRSMWLEPGPRNGPYGPFEMFELIL